MSDGRADVLVIGAGPAGAAAAWSAAAAGAGRVLLVERCPWPRTKVCGSCVNPAGLTVLERMGVFDHNPPASTALSRLRVQTPRASAAIDVDAGVAIERSSLDAALASAAERAGAKFQPRSSAKVLAREGSAWRVRAGDREILATVVIACDGLTGASLAAVSDAEGLGVAVDPHSWMGAGVVVPAERAAPWHDAAAPGEVAMHVGEGGYVGLVRLHDGRIDVAAALDVARAKAAGGPGPAMGAILEACAVPDASARLAGESIGGTGLLTRRRARPGAPGLIVAGDALAYVEPFTGEGITWALVQGEHAGALAARAARDPRAWPDLADEWSRWLHARIDPRRRPCRAARWTLRRDVPRRCAVAVLSNSSLARAAAGALASRVWRAYSSLPVRTPGNLPCG